jgi:putative component of membrane protein insertase Oxa1/YidC/SpoIIIJ protein YidD
VVDHTLLKCKAFDNKKHGVTWNSNLGVLTLTNCNASGNGGNDFKKVTNIIQ